MTALCVSLTSNSFVEAQTDRQTDKAAEMLFSVAGEMSRRAKQRERESDRAREVCLLQNKGEGRKEEDEQGREREREKEK